MIRDHNDPFASTAGETTRSAQRPEISGSAPDLPQRVNAEGASQALRIAASHAARKGKIRAAPGLRPAPRFRRGFGTVLAQSRHAADTVAGWIVSEGETKPGDGAARTVIVAMAEP